MNNNYILNPLNVPNWPPSVPQLAKLKYTNKQIENERNEAIGHSWLSVKPHLKHSKHNLRA